MYFFFWKSTIFGLGISLTALLCVIFVAFPLPHDVIMYFSSHFQSIHAKARKHAHIANTLQSIYHKNSLFSKRVVFNWKHRTSIIHSLKCILSVLREDIWVVENNHHSNLFKYTKVFLYSNAERARELRNSKFARICNISLHSPAHSSPFQHFI